jgi:hypothetical protein
MHADAFSDTSVLLSLLSEDFNQADRIEELLAELTPSTFRP